MNTLVRTLVQITLIVGLTIAFAMTLLYKISDAPIPLLPKFNDPANGLLYGSSSVYLIALIVLGFIPATDENNIRLEKSLFVAVLVVSVVEIALYLL